MNVSSYVQMIVIGGVILVAVSWDNLRTSGSLIKFLSKLKFPTQSNHAGN